MMSIASTGLRHQLYTSQRTPNGLYKSVRTLYGLLERPTARHDAVLRLQTTGMRQYCDKLSQNRSVPVNTQGYKFLHNRLGACHLGLFTSDSWKQVSPLCTQATGNSGNAKPTSSGVQSHETRQDGGSLLAKLLQNFLRALGILLLAAILAAASLPSLLSWSPARRTAINLVNKSIPGTLSVSSVSLGWMHPVQLEGFSLQGTDGENVLLIPKVETTAPLWSIFLGRSGLGDCTVTSPVIDLQQHPTNNLPRLALAVTSAEKLLEKSPRAKRQGKQQVAPANTSLTVEVKAPKGGLKVTDGKIIFPSDVAAVLGERLLVNVGVGSWATKESDELKLSEEISGVPLIAALWSETAQAEAVGFIRKKEKQIKLIKPLKIEMDLTPAVAKFYLARINPLLGEIVGPRIQDEDMPDVTVQVTPENLELPAEHYQINIAPMNVTLARGEMVDGLLSLLSQQEKVKGSRNITMRTSAIQADVDMPSTVKSSRLDVLIADRVHVATWGTMDWINESVQMTIAIPGKSLRDLLGLTLPLTYYLKIPVTGTLEKLKVDWRTAGIGLAEQTARQQGARLMQSLFGSPNVNPVTSKSDIPEPIGILPWETKNVALRE